MSDVSGNGSGAELPKIKLIIADEREIDSTYPNLEVVCEKGHAPEVFNKHIDPECYCMCLGANEYLVPSYLSGLNTPKDPLTILLDKVNDRGIAKGVYCDIEYGDKAYPYYQRHPSWEPKLLKGQTLISSPMLFRPDPDVKYNEKLDALYHFQFILEYALTNFILHHPETLIRIDEQGHNIDQELETIKACLAQ